jgi:hypothetical protein
MRIEPFTLHDIRRNVANSNRHAVEQRVALEKWARHLDGLA